MSLTENYMRAMLAGFQGDFLEQNKVARRSHFQPQVVLLILLGIGMGYDGEKERVEELLGIVFHAA